MCIPAFVAGAICSYSQPQGIVLADLTWQQAEKVLTPDAVVMIPLGAESKEHGPHLLLKTARELMVDSCRGFAQN